MVEPREVPFDIIVCKQIDWVKWLADHYQAVLIYHPNGRPLAVGGVPVFTMVPLELIVGKRVLGVLPYLFAAQAKSVSVLKISHSYPHLPFEVSAPMVVREVEPTVPRASHERMTAALNAIACWNEGLIVNGSFDEPHSAKLAREALIIQNG